MNKKAQAYGLSWFFSTIVIFFILVLFVASSALLGFSNKNSVTVDSLKNFNNVKNLNEFDAFYEYGNNETVGSLSYLSREEKINIELTNYFLSYSREVYNLSKDNKENIKNNCLVLLLSYDGIFDFSTSLLNDILPTPNEKLANAQAASPSFSNLAKINNAIYINNKNGYFPIAILSEGC